MRKDIVPPEALEFALTMALKQMDEQRRHGSAALNQMWSEEWEQRKRAKKLLEESDASSITLEI